MPLPFVMPAKAGIQYSPIFVVADGRGLLDRPVKPGDDKKKKGENNVTRKGKGSRSEEGALARYCADRLCLWRLCGQYACTRARSCRGDVEACSGLALAWLAALERQEDLAPTFAAMEARIETPHEMRLYRQWRDLLARAKAHAETPTAETALMRDKLRRQIEVLARQPEPDRPS